MACALLLATGAIALSELLDEESPETAVSLYPFGAEPRLASVIAALNATPPPSDLEDLREAVLAGVRYNSGDARLYSLMSEIDVRSGRQPDADRTLDRSRELSKTEIYALERTISHRIEAGRIGAAVDGIDILLRRWPGRFNNIAGIFPQLALDPEGYKRLLDVTAKETPWRGRLLSTLVKGGRGLGSADRLVMDLAKTTSPPTRSELSSVIAGHIAQKDYSGAYRIFLFTLGERERALTGYVFNDRFAPVATGLPFDWQVPKQSGAEVSYLKRAAGSEGVQIRFLGKPVKGSSLNQSIQLQAGTFELVVEASAQDLRLPKQLFWTVRCADQRRETVRLPIPDGSYKNQRLTASFPIPFGTCKLATLSLDTDLVAESFRHRYTGALTLHSVRIERPDA